MSDAVEKTTPAANSDVKLAPDQLPVKAKPSAPVIPLPLKKVAGTFQTGAVATLRPQALRRRLLKISFVAAVILPTLLGALYFLAIASDRYAASAGFSVRSMDPAVGGTDLLSSISGLSSGGSTTTDSYIILEYLKSRELVEKLMQEVDFQEAYGNDKIDALYKLELTKPIEDIVDYWDWMITTSFDNASSIITFEVQAFTAEDAEKVAALIVKYCQNLINKLSQQARRDAVSFAKKEVASAELRLKLIREELRDFRAQSSAVDPAATAAANLELTTGLEGELIRLRAQLATLLTALSEDAPSVQQLKKQITSIEAEMVGKRAEVSGKTRAIEGQENLSELLANYERLKVEQEFAQQAYTVTLASLERSRTEADRQQRFLAVFKNPSRPQDAIYPERVLNTFLVFLVALILWGIGTLLTYSVRDHMR